MAILSAVGAEKCGLPEAMRSKVPLVHARPVRSHNHDSEHFRVWFDLEGAHAIPSIRWAERCAEFLEKARAVLVDSIGFREPIPDSSLFPGRTDVGGDDRLDIYFTHMEYYGMTYLDTVLAGGVGPAFILIENDFDAARFPQYIGREEEALAVTCAHEFFHAIHYSYGSSAAWTWWMEATAVWSEERIFPHVDDYLDYLPNFQSTPEGGLNSDSPRGRMYGTCLLPMFLSTNYGDRAILEIWELVPENQVFPAISIWAFDEGIRPIDLYGDFAMWNLFVGENYRGWGYDDAHLMPAPKITHRDSLPTLLTSAGAAIYTSTPSFGEGGIWAEYTPLAPADSLSACVHGISKRGTDTPDTTIDIYSTPDTIPGAWRFDGLFTTLANLGPNPATSSRIGNLLIGPAPDARVAKPGDIVDRTPYPNPFIYGEHDTLLFPFTAGDVSQLRFTVWTASGELVFEETGDVSLGYHLTPRGAFGWLPRNQDGKPIASGIYIYFLSLDDNSFTGKFAVIAK